MRKLTVLSMISLDGVMQAPGGTGEDPSNGFAYGGWTASYGDAAYNAAVTRELEPADYLLGRCTFEIWEPYWPQHADFWPGINSGNKYVLSTTRSHSDWAHSSFVKNVDAIRQIKASEGRDLQVWGSSELVHLLLAHDLVDELRLKIHPLILGKGKKLFSADAVPAAFVLTESQVTSKGVILAAYRRDGAIVTGNLGA